MDEGEALVALTLNSECSKSNGMSYYLDIVSYILYGVCVLFVLAIEIHIPGFSTMCPSGLRSSKCTDSSYGTP